MSNISAYIILIIAVALGTAANGFAKSAQGFTVLIPSIITAITIHKEIINYVGTVRPIKIVV